MTYAEINEMTYNELEAALETADKYEAEMIRDQMALYDFD